MQKPRKIDTEKTDVLESHTIWWLNRLPGWRIFAVNQNHGACYYRKKYITIPTWAWYRGDDYVTYYVAHEVSHMLGPCYHDGEFYQVFLKICPDYAQHYELDYKPRAAAAAGITSALGSPWAKP